MKKIIAILCTLTMLLSLVCVSISAAVRGPRNWKDDPKHLTGSDLTNWISNNFQKTSTVDMDEVEYSFAFVGDTQYVTYFDLKNGTNNLDKVYGWIADNIEEKKIANVFTLGDMTDVSYGNDSNISHIGWQQQGLNTYSAEWEIVKKATDQLNGKVPYFVTRGNHDDYQIDDYYGNDSTYMSQFSDGGFYTETSKSSYYYEGEPTITNAWRTFEVDDDKYLFMTIDFEAPLGVIDWASDVISSHPNHKVIITTHSYLVPDGTLNDKIKDRDSYGADSVGLDARSIRQRLVTKHKNIIMVVAGHSSCNDIFYTWDKGNAGNDILNVLVDAQDLDKSKTFLGLVGIMHFSEGGKKIQLEYYSPLLDMYRKGNNDIIRLDDAQPSTEGNINLAALGDYGQQNAVVSDKSSTAPKLDGKISSGEYSTTKVTPQAKAPLGKYESDLTEYFAYDNEYLYYAYSMKNSSRAGNKVLSLYASNGIHTFDSLTNGEYGRRIDIAFNATASEGAKQGTIENTSFSCMRWDTDIFLGASYNSSTMEEIYEFKISRTYLRQNNLSDSSLAYTVMLGKDSSNKDMQNYTRVTSDMKNYISEQGVKKTFLSLYNYAFFGEVPEMVLMTTAPATTIAPATEAPIEETSATDAPKKKGCKGEALSLIAILPALTMGTTVFVSKKKKKK